MYNGCCRRPWLDEYKRGNLLEDLEKVIQSGIEIDGKRLEGISTEMFKEAKTSMLHHCPFLTTLQVVALMAYSQDMLEAAGKYGAKIDKEWMEREEQLRKLVEIASRGVF